MQDDASVNPHFLRQLMTLATVEEVNAAEDVYSTTGLKLISKGAQLDPNLYERIVSHKLKKPLESSICVGEPITPQLLSETASVLLDASPALRKFMGNDCSEMLVQSLVKRARYSLQAGSLLKIHQSKVARSVHHGMLVGLLAMGMQRRMSPGDSAELDTLIVASIFHDIGELYLAPELFRAADIPLTPQEWQQMSAHPVIGHAVLKNMSGIAPGVADLVLVHHERIDGSGYPRQLTDRDLSKEGRILAVAEMLSRFIGEAVDPFAHASIALRIIPGEFDPHMVDIIVNCGEELRKAKLLQQELAAHDAAMPPSMMLPPTETLRPEFRALLLTLEKSAAAITRLDEVCANEGGSTALKKVFPAVRLRYERIVRAVSSSGLDQAVEGLEVGQVGREELAQIRLEFSSVLDEIRWRLIELSRQVALQGMSMQGDDAPLYDSLATALEPSRS